MREPEDYLVTTRCEAFKTVLVHGCHSKAEALRKARSLEDKDVEGLDFEVGAIYFSTARAFAESELGKNTRSRASAEEKKT